MPYFEAISSIMTKVEMAIQMDIDLKMWKLFVIIHKSRGGVSLIEQDTIENVSWPIHEKTILNSCS